MNPHVPVSLQLRLSNLILRNLFKVIYKQTHPRSHKHNRRYWPYYQIERNSQGGIAKIYFKRKLLIDQSKALTNPQMSKCMLIATGPSINQLPQHVFKQQNVDYIGVNGAISLQDIKFKYYVIIDHNFTHKRFDLVQQVLKSDCTFFTTARCLDLILRKIKPNEIKCNIHVLELVTEDEVEQFLGPRTKVNPHQADFFTQGDKSFSKHIYGVVFDYFTVAYVALQVIHQLQYEQIYLAGLDMNNFHQPRFYEKTEDKQPTMLNQYLKDTLPAFDVAANFFEQQNIQVYNLSPESAVNSFKKLMLEDITSL